MAKNKYFEIYQEIKADITTGTYPTGSKLPSEHTLCDYYQVSRNTVRRALDSLAQEGFVTSVHGKGVFVMDKPPVSLLVGGLHSFSEASEQAHAVIQTTVPFFESLLVDSTLSQKTGFAVGTTLVHLIRIRVLDGIPAILDENYFDATLIPGMNTEIAQKSIYNYIEHTLKLKIHGAQKTIAIEPATQIDEHYLHVDTHQLMAIIKTHVYLDNGQQFEYTESRHLPERFVFQTFARR
ncbi:MAG: trehalose operon repressor [Culicoidibacterales bacterium]